MHDRNKSGIDATFTLDAITKCADFTSSVEPNAVRRPVSIQRFSHRGEAVPTVSATSTACFVNGSGCVFVILSAMVLLLYCSCDNHHMDFFDDDDLYALHKMYTQLDLYRNVLANFHNDNHVRLSGSVVCRIAANDTVCSKRTSGSPVRRHSVRNVLIRVIGRGISCKIRPIRY